MLEIKRDILVSPEVAILAKAKGLYQSSTNSETINSLMCLYTDNVVRGFWFNPYNHLAIMPRLNELQRWLREEHNIHIIVKPFYDALFNQTSYGADIVKSNENWTKRSARWNTYEKCLEDALQIALTTI